MELNSEIAGSELCQDKTERVRPMDRADIEMVAAEVEAELPDRGRGLERAEVEAVVDIKPAD